MTRAFLVLMAAGSLCGIATAQPPDLAGKWSGYWVSDKNGHTGPLHGRFRQIDADTYRVAFRGRFWGVFPFWYSTKMEVAASGDGVTQLIASRRLGPLGTFTTTALATDSRFDATFSSRNDSGRFVLSRRR